MLFTDVRDAAAANSVQFAEIQFEGLIPEPGTGALAGIGLAAVALHRRRNRALNGTRDSYSSARCGLNSYNLAGG